MSDSDPGAKSKVSTAESGSLPPKSNPQEMPREENSRSIADLEQFTPSATTTTTDNALTQLSQNDQNKSYERLKRNEIYRLLTATEASVKDITQYVCKISELSGGVSGVATKIESLREGDEELRRKLDDFSRVATEQSNELNAVRTASSKIEQQLNDISAIAARIQDANQDTREQLGQLLSLGNSSIVSSSSSSKSLIARIGSATLLVVLVSALGLQIYLGKEMVAVTRRMAASTNQLDNAGKKLGTASDQTSTKLKEIADQWTEATSAVRDARGKLDSLSADAESATKKAMETSNSLANARGALESVNKSLAPAPGEAAKAITDIKRVLSSLDDEVKSALAAFVAKANEGIAADRRRLADLQQLYNHEFTREPVVVFIGDTGRANTGFLRRFLDQVLKRSKERGVAVPNRQLAIYLPKGADIGSPLSIEDQYIPPSSVATVEWSQLSVDSLFANSKPRCIIVCDGSAEPPLSEQEVKGKWKEFLAIDVVLLRASAPIEDTFIERTAKWERLAKLSNGIALTVATEGGKTESHERVGIKVAAVLRGLLDGPLVSSAATKQ